ncbi:MAG: outer membrane protein assembly factor BamB [Gammaproteobacteria bacterium]|nr:outer membrane protein assembly factor BamB [Gammaproteobacteria bacterium]
MKNRMSRILALLLALALLSGCNSNKVPKPTVWGRFHEPVKAEELPDDSGVDEIHVLWKKNIGVGVKSGYARLVPAFAGGDVFVASRDGNVMRLDAESGSTIWRKKLDSPISFAVGLGGNLAVVGHDNGNVTALSVADGQTAWTVSVQRQISAVPAAVSEAVVIRTSDGRIIGLDPASGEQRWLLETELPGLTIQGDSMPLLGQDYMLVGLSNGKLMVGNSVTGRLFWEADIGVIGGRNDIERINDVDSTPMIRGTTAYAAAYQGYVKALSINSGDTLWQTEYSTRLPMALGPNRLFVTSELGEVAALEAVDGTIAWRQEIFRGHGMSSPVSVDGRVLIGDAEGRLHSLDPLSGDLVDTRNIVSGAVLAIVENGRLGAVLSSEGELALVDVRN